MSRKECPKCKKSKDIKKFGQRLYKGKTYKQSYCIECRGQKTSKTSKRGSRNIKSRKHKLVQKRTNRSKSLTKTKAKGSKAELANKIKQLESAIAIEEKRLSPV